MRCSGCGIDNPDDVEFCTNCGAKLEAAASSPTPTAPVEFCPQCGSQVRQGARFCDRCGHDLSKPARKQVAREVSPVARALPLPNTIAAGTGAIMMLVSLAVPWYTPRAYGQELGYDLKVGDLLDPGCAGWPGCPNWLGWGLPVVLMIVFASLALISVIYSFATRSATRSVWSLLGTLCAWCIIGNAVYVLFWHFDQTRTAPLWDGIWMNIVQVGSALAFAGALVVIFSGAIGRRRP